MHLCFAEDLCIIASYHQHYHLETRQQYDRLMGCLRLHPIYQAECQLLSLELDLIFVGMKGSLVAVDVQ
jgi:hypothetical protein